MGVHMRGPREKSEHGFYHVVMRGSGRQILFEDDAARCRFLELLSHGLEKCKVKLLAWCLMSNHVHLLVCDEEEGLSNLLHDLQTSFAIYFNHTSGHVGHVFQGRFSSVAICSDEQLLQAVRYIHDNPVRSGLSPRDEYPWSSYHEYAPGPASLISPELILDMVGGRERFSKFSEEGGSDGYVFRCGVRYDDEDAMLVARRALGSVAPTALKALVPSMRDPLLQQLRDAGLTVRQIERVTGIGRSTISHATRRRA